MTTEPAVLTVCEELSTPSTLLPGVTARGDATDYTDALTAPLVDLDEAVAGFEAGALDLGEASGTALDLLGDFASEERGGMTDPEYRRLIAGRRVVLESTVTTPAVWRAWSGLTELLSGTIDLYQYELRLVADVPYLPRQAWVQRVGLVMRDTVKASKDVYGLIAQPGCFRWGINSFDDAGFGFDFGV